MSSIARHHNEWLSLVEISGPFLSLPVLMRTFPQGLDALDRDRLAELRLAYEEWLDNQSSLRPSPAIHSVWARYVLERVLGFEKASLLEGPAIPATLQTYVAEQGETLRPDLVVSDSHLLPGDGSRSTPAAERREPGVRLLIQLHPADQGLEKAMHNRRWKASPAMRMLDLLRATGVPLGMVTNGEQWMLVHAPKGETSAFVSWYAALWLEEPLTLRAFTSLLGAARFFSVASEDTLEGMLKDSVNEQQEVTDQLGYQVRRAVEVLIRAVDRADQDRGRTLLKDIRESDLYEAALTVMMRLVFLFSAEERGLLLLGDPLYDQNYAVSTLRAQLRETADQQGEEVLERRFDAWCRLLATFRAVHGGIHHDRLNLPAYGGSLFDPERYPFLEGRLPSPPAPLPNRNLGEGGPLPISNRTVLHLLEALQILRVKVPGGGPAEARRLSFRALDVEQIGHVYEGLLDHIAVRAGEPVLGLAGTREKEPEIPLPKLEQLLPSPAGRGQGEGQLAFLKEHTGRSENALRKALEQKDDLFANQHLQIACNNDARIYASVLPFAGLLRADDFGYPAVFLPGSVYVTAGATRRATGTHYTPRSLTEPIVQHTLEPLVYAGPAEGLPKESWQLRSPAELLELKVCDIAMGSAGFLVQVVRYLSERLVEAWEAISPLAQNGRGAGGEGAGLEIKITPEGKPASGKPGELILPADDEERLVLARRLVADRCIYGVDKNPLAVEIAKLSIWLTTMDKGRPFTFLDHALKCGDSLVGADEDMYRKWAYNLKGAQFTLYLTTLEEFAAEARQKRKELESFTVLDVRDAQHKAALLKEADAAVARVKLGCDLLVGARLLGLKPAEQETLLERLLWDYVAGKDMDTPDAQRALHAARKERAFHWPFEFPEVFERGGFGAFVGNPPFIGGRRLRETLGDNYKLGLDSFFVGSSGNADYCALFFLKGFYNLQKNGAFGLIATNTISQGDTRVTGLEKIINSGGVVFKAFYNVSWPGQASVSVSIVHIYKGKFSPPYLLDDEVVKFISSFLDREKSLGNPYRLKENSDKSFNGSVIAGIGFVLTPPEATILLSQNEKYKEVIFPYLNAEDYNENPSQSPSRFIINFFDWPIERAKNYTIPFQIVSERVLPTRKNANREAHRKYWWQYGDKRPALYNKIRNYNEVLVCPRVTKYLSFAFIPNEFVYADRLYIFSFVKFSEFAVLQSCFQESWARKYSATLETRLNYAATDAFENFPFPIVLSSIIENIGETYHKTRHQIMHARQEGLTTTYNRFHNSKETASDFINFRNLQVEMDNAVASAYGWSDLDLGHGFHETPQGVRFTISEPARREVLARLLQLNHERYEEEVKAGLHEEKKGKKGEQKDAEDAPQKLAASRRGRHAVKEQPSLLYAVDSPPDEPAAGQAQPPAATPAGQIGKWDQCVCLDCGKHLVGFSIEEHTQKVHGGKDPGYRKMGR